MIGFAAGPLAKTGLPMPYLGCPTLSSFFTHTLNFPSSTLHLGITTVNKSVFTVLIYICSELIRINIIYLFIYYL